MFRTFNYILSNNLNCTVSDMLNCYDIIIISNNTIPWYACYPLELPYLSVITDTREGECFKMSAQFLNCDCILIHLSHENKTLSVEFSRQHFIQEIHFVVFKIDKWQSSQQDMPPFCQSFSLDDRRILSSCFCQNISVVVNLYLSI